MFSFGLLLPMFLFWKFYCVFAFLFSLLFRLVCCPLPSCFVVCAVCGSVFHSLARGAKFHMAVIKVYWNFETVVSSQAKTCKTKMFVVKFVAYPRLINSAPGVPVVLHLSSAMDLSTTVEGNVTKQEQNTYFTIALSRTGKSNVQKQEQNTYFTIGRIFYNWLSRRL